MMAEEGLRGQPVGNENEGLQSQPAKCRFIVIVGSFICRRRCDDTCSADEYS